jgi:hypothetical protein
MQLKGKSKRKSQPGGWLFEKRIKLQDLAWISPEAKREGKETSRDRLSTRDMENEQDKNKNNLTYQYIVVCRR